jgi:hypothetical protein
MSLLKGTQKVQLNLALAVQLQEVSCKSQSRMLWIKHLLPGMKNKSECIVNLHTEEHRDAAATRLLQRTRVLNERHALPQFGFENEF